MQGHFFGVNLNQGAAGNAAGLSDCMPACPQPELQALAEWAHLGVADFPCTLIGWPGASNASTQHMYRLLGVWGGTVQV